MAREKSAPSVTLVFFHFMELRQLVVVREVRL